MEQFNSHQEWLLHMTHALFALQARALFWAAFSCV